MTYELTVSGTVYTFNLEGDFRAAWAWVQDYLTGLGEKFPTDACGDVAYTLRCGDRMWTGFYS